MKYILILILAIFPLFTYAGQNATISELEKKEVIDSIGQTLQEVYIYPELTKKIVAKLSTNLESGVYKSIKNPKEFSAKLTQDLRSISKDLHFLVYFDEEWVTDKRKAKDPKNKAALLKKEIELAAKDNFGFKEVKILKGNVGYLKLTTFYNPEIAGETAAASMKFLSNSDALIIDLRDNNGGYVEMAQFLSSYFFEHIPSQALFDVSYLEEKKRTERTFWVLPTVPSKRMLDTDVYILINLRSFSSAEWMAYSLKNLKRATIIGEKTAGAAHPVDRIIVSNRFSVNVPIGLSKDPITKTDFEGVGVQPDIAVSAKNALFTAHFKALEKLATTVPKENNKYLWYLPVIKSQMNSVSIDEKTLKSYTGTFGSRTLTFEKGRLYYDWNNLGKLELVPITSDIFVVDEFENFRLKILKENGEFVGFMRIYQDGSTKKYLKDKK